MSSTRVLETPAGPVSLAFDGPKNSPVRLVLAHGAGGDMTSAFMSATAGALAADMTVVRFNFPYAEKGGKRPDPAPVLEGAFEAVVESVRPTGPNRCLVLGGKSMGGRIASQIVAGGLDCDGLVFLGYPLHPPGRPERLRDAHLANVKVPMLFVEGTRDPFCPLDTLERVRTRLLSETEVAVINGGDHSFKMRASSPRTTEEAWAEVVDSVRKWVAQLRSTP